MTGTLNLREAQELAKFVQGQLEQIPPVERLRRFSLASYAYIHLPPGDPRRLEVRLAHREQVLRRQIVLAELKPLFEAWRAAGIRVMVFKGYHLAEFVYANPDLRPYGDIDVMIVPEQAALASSLAQHLGFRETWNVTDSLNDHKHELFNLVSRSGQVVVDVHSRLLHNILRRNGRQQRITRGVWERSVWLNEAGLYGPAPVDALLVGLILNRLWVPEHWTIKPQDLLDFRALIEQAGVTLEGLLERAQEFGCLRTVRQFLGRCNGFTNRIDLRPSTTWQRLRWDVQLLPERGSITGEYAINLIGKVPSVVQDVLRELPGVLRVLGRLRAVRDLPELLRRLTPLPTITKTPTQRDCQRVVRGVHLCLLLMRVRLGSSCLPRSLALYVAFRRLGLPAVFCAGVRRNVDGIDSHAWVELHGVPIHDPYYHENPGRYRVNLRYPLD